MPARNETAQNSVKYPSVEPSEGQQPLEPLLSEILDIWADGQLPNGQVPQVTSNLLELVKIDNQDHPGVDLSDQERALLSLLVSSLADIPHSILWTEIHALLPSKRLMSSIEITLVRSLMEWGMNHHAASGNPPRMDIWSERRAALYGSLDSIRLGLYAFLGMIILSRHNHQYIMYDAPVDDGLELSIAKIYNLAVNLYQYLLQETTRLMGKVLDHTIAETEAKILMVALLFLLSILGCKPAGTCPLVDFTRGGHDFISYSIRYLRTNNVLLPFLQGLPFAYRLPTFDENHTLTLPFISRILEFIDGHATELGSGNDLSTIRYAFSSFEPHVYRTTLSDNPHYYYHYFVTMKMEMWDLVYAQHSLALSWLNLVAAYAFLFKLYFIRTNNLWIEYMEWYRAWHGHTYYWDAPLYHMVVEQSVVVDDYTQLHLFDPVATTNQG